MKAIVTTCMLLSACFAISLSGCGSKDVKTTAKKTSNTDNAASTQGDQSAKSDAQSNKLVGLWLGVTGYDEELVNEKLKTLTDPKLRQNFINQIRTFDTMVVGYEFKPNNEMEMEVQIQPFGGELIGSQMVGTWESTQTNEKTLAVKITETGEGGKSSVKYCTFVDENTFAIKPTVSDELMDIKPMILFERQPDEIPQSAAATSQETLK